MNMLIVEPELREKIPSRAYNDVIREPRIGVMLHYDASGSDAGALSWFKHPECHVSYNWLVLDDGRYAEIAPRNARAWHAGVCYSSNERLNYKDANSAFYGIAIASNEHESVFIQQLLTAAWLAQQCFLTENWDRSNLWRIVGHEDEAFKRGRKKDPTGSDKKRPVMRTEDVRWLVSQFKE